MSSQKLKSKRPSKGLSIDEVEIPTWGDKGAPLRSQFKDDQEFKAALLQHELSSRFKTMMDTARLPSKIDPARILNLRFSGLPFCSLRWFLKLPVNLGREKMVDFGFTYFTKVGTAVHEVVQNLVERSSGLDFLKDFVCSNPDCRKRYALLPRSPLSCEHCGSSDFDSEEHEVVWNGAIGHVDEIVVLDAKNHPKRIVILDYKTTSTLSLNREDPVEYVSQIRSYATALTDRGFEVEGVFLMYIPRDNPFGWRLSPVKWSSQIYKSHRKWMEFWVDEHKAGMSVATLEDARDLVVNRPCTSSSQPKCFSGCEFSDFCCSPGKRPPKMMSQVESTYSQVKRWLPLNKRLPKQPSS